MHVKLRPGPWMQQPSPEFLNGHELQGPSVKVRLAQEGLLPKVHGDTCGARRGVGGRAGDGVCLVFGR